MPEPPTAADPDLVPSVDPAEAARLVRERWGVEGTARELAGERDRNFRIRGEGVEAVLKVSHGAEEPALLEAQDAALERLAERGLDRRVPRTLQSIDGRRIVPVDVGGRPHLARLVEWLPGRLLAETRPHTPALLEELGALLGSVDRALDGFGHPGAERESTWDLRRGREVVAAHLAAVEDPDRRRLVLRALEPLDAAPLDELPVQVVHGDANDWNVVVAREGSGPWARDHVSGLIDFGDLVRSWRVADPAIACAYAMLDKRAPLRAAARVVAGYHRVRPLDDAEIAALEPLVRLRLAVSVVLSAHHRAVRPGEAYLAVSEAPAWALLGRLSDASSGFATCVFRDACGLEPSPASARVRAWLADPHPAPRPVLEAAAGAESTTTLDLGLESPHLLELGGRDDAEAWTRVLFRRMEDAGVPVGVGAWNEVRGWYSGPAYRVETDEGPEWRTVHLGVDLFAPPGTPVLAPLDATVAAARDNRGALDYGPTLLLRHDVPGADGRPVVFHSLWGHLDAASLEGREAGSAVSAGEVLGRIGAPSENGGWAPHVHVQVVTDLLEHRGTFPGVALPSERDVWLSLSPDPSALCGVAGAADGHGPDPEDLLERRRRSVGPNLSVSYRSPIVVVRGRGTWLYDADGQAYLDAVNNVAHVGHEHPRVVDALARQAAVLNTNTRYLHPTLLRYAERLAATLPDPLRVCFFVSSGSEANELALRMARTRTGRHDVVVLDAAYHGNTGSLVAMSPYKFDGPGGAGRAEWVHVADLPDAYRGRLRGAGPEVAEGYADGVRDALTRAAGRGPGAAAFFHESLPGCGGQIVLPDGYLARAYAHAREAGALCVADEVQVGFGRVGSHFWGFETQGVVPDVVTLGKPMGNGHPLGAVVTTPEVAEAFDTGMEFFSTFGGNPVSAAAGLAVMDVLEDEGLQAAAAATGAGLLRDLGAVAARHPLVGDVRGLGLYVGVELVTGGDAREPAAEHASRLVERLRDHRILVSTDGPDGNVVKIKPPMVFGPSHAERLVETLDRVLAEDALRP